MRYVAESPWYPTVLLPGRGVRGEAVDHACANAALIDGPITLTLLFRFNGAGLIESVRAAARGAGVGNDAVMVMLPWDCAIVNRGALLGLRWQERLSSALAPTVEPCQAIAS